MTLNLNDVYEATRTETLAFLDSAAEDETHDVEGVTIMVSLAECAATYRALYNAKVAAVNALLDGAYVGNSLVKPSTT